MRVAVWYSNRDVRLEERPIPAIGPQELLVRVEASGLCGSDALEWYRLNRAPLVLGHEVAGVVVAVGKEIERFKEGDRVTVAHHVPCLACHYCLSGHPSVCDTLLRGNFDPGGFAEFVRVPAINVEHGTFLLPQDMSFEEATFSEPLGCVVRGQRLAGMASGRSVLIIGSGIAGLLHVLLARAWGASSIIASDRVEYRLKKALELGANVALHADEDVPRRLREVNQGRLADLVIVCTSALSAFQQALRSVERGGAILFFAPAEPGASLPLPLNEVFWRTEVTLTSSYASPPADTKTALELLHSRRVNVREMITHRLSLAETGLGFHLLTHPQESNSIKVIIEPQR